MPSSHEARRSAIAAALRRVAREPIARWAGAEVVSRGRPIATGRPIAPATQLAPTPPATAMIEDVQRRLDSLAGQLDQVLTRLDSVETALLESVWDDGSASAAQPAGAAAADGEGDGGEGEQADDEADDRRVSVPAIGLSGGMSTDAARALFGG